MDEIAKMYDEQCGYEWAARDGDGTHSCTLRGGHHPRVPHQCWCAEHAVAGARVELSGGE